MEHVQARVVHLQKELVTRKPRRGSLAMRRYRTRVSRLAFRFAELALAFVFFGAVAHHVFTFDFKPLAALCIPIIAVFFSFSSLLFIRGRSLAKGRGQMRSLYGAERAMQATVWYLFGIILGTGLYGILMRFGVTFDPSEPSPDGLWLFVFLAPYALMQIGLLCFMSAIWAITPNFVRRVGAFEVARRVQQ
jgi:hypothetical protein